MLTATAGLGPNGHAGRGAGSKGEAGARATNRDVVCDHRLYPALGSWASALMVVTMRGLVADEVLASERHGIPIGTL